jgi:cytochrome c oxidase assembly factor CtaG
VSGLLGGLSDTPVSVVDGDVTAVVLAHATPGSVPPELTPWRLLTAWTFEPVVAVGVVAIAAAYLVGVHRLHARGAYWSRWRTASFLGLGLGGIVVATMSALGTYDAVLISVHMVQHMLLTMVVPIFLALGAPITLALRTLPRRPRGWLLAALHSRVAKVLTFPLVAMFLFVLNPFVLYFTGWYEATLRNPVLHDLNHLHFVLIGCLFFWPLLGLDPMPTQPPYPLRMLAVFVTLPFHAFLGIAIMSMTDVLAVDWYTSLDRQWGASYLSDQQTAGGILWAAGDLVALIVLIVLFIQWMRASEREAEREDRRLDRLEALGDRDGRLPFGA